MIFVLCHKLDENITNCILHGTIIVILVENVLGYAITLLLCFQSSKPVLINSWRSWLHLTMIIPGGLEVALDLLQPPGPGWPDDPVGVLLVQVQPRGAAGVGVLRAQVHPLALGHSQGAGYNIGVSKVIKSLQIRDYLAINTKINISFWFIFC